MTSFKRRHSDGQAFPVDSSGGITLDAFGATAAQDSARQAQMATNDARRLEGAPSFRQPTSDSLRGDTLNSYLAASGSKALSEFSGPKIAIVTACGNKKECQSMPAWRLYKSSRIKAVYSRRQGHDMMILSAKHGLLPAERLTEPYNQVMSKERAQELFSSIVDGLKGYDAVIYFKAGARKEYADLMERAAQAAGVKLISFGSGNMAGIGDLPKMIEQAQFYNERK